MRHRQCSLHTYNVTTCLLLLSLLIAAPITSSAARHSRSDLVGNEKSGGKATGATAKAASYQALSSEEKQDVGNPVAIVTSIANKTTKADSLVALENNKEASSAQSEDNSKAIEQLQQENKELQLDIGDEDIEFTDKGGEDNDIANDQDSNFRECDKELIGFEIITG